jgi:lysophospholipase L1-like esterase
MSTWKQRYTALAIIVLNTCLLFAAVNLLLWGALRFFRRSRPFDPVATFGLATVLKCYPGWKPEDVVALSREMGKLDEAVYEYEPFTQFKHRPLRGRYLNIDPNGFRIDKNQGPWPPQRNGFNIFLFGGSTTLGVGVPDDETIPSYLQEYMAAHCRTRAAVYNFGRLGYFSTQEVLLYYRLLSSGAVPTVAVFVDGINDFHSWSGEPDLTTELKSLLAAEHRSWQPPSDLPVWRAANMLRRWMAGERAAPASPDYRDAQFQAGVASRLRTTERLIETLGSEFHVQPVFVWQPVPVYKYDLQYHFLNGLDHRRLFQYADGAKYGYPVMAEARDEFESGGRFLWLADIQEGRSENFYLSDGLHYTGRFCQEIARAIYQFMLRKGLVEALGCRASG